MNVNWWEQTSLKKKHFCLKTIIGLNNRVHSLNRTLIPPVWHKIKTEHFFVLAKMRDLKTLGRHYAAVLQKTAPLLHRVHPGVLKKKRATGSTSNIRSCRSETEDEDETRPRLCFFIFSTSSVMSHSNDDGLLVFSLSSVSGVGWSGCSPAASRSSSRSSVCWTTPVHFQPRSQANSTWTERRNGDIWPQRITSQSFTRLKEFWPGKYTPPSCQLMAQRISLAQGVFSVHQRHDRKNK